MHRPSNHFLISILIIFLSVFILSMFVFDVGINSKYFIRKDFNKAFQYLLTRDCMSFNNYYLGNGGAQWCKEWNNLDSGKIKNYKILYLTHNFFSNNAYLNVELSLLTSSGKNLDTTIKIKMQKDILTWKITR